MTGSLIDSWIYLLLECSLELIMKAMSCTIELRKRLLNKKVSVGFGSFLDRLVISSHSLSELLGSLLVYFFCEMVISILQHSFSSYLSRIESLVHLWWYVIILVNSTKIVLIMRKCSRYLLLIASEILGYDWFKKSKNDSKSRISHSPIHRIIERSLIMHRFPFLDDLIRLLLGIQEVVNQRSPNFSWGSMITQMDRLDSTIMRSRIILLRIIDRSLESSFKILHFLMIVFDTISPMFVMILQRKILYVHVRRHILMNFSRDFQSDLIR